MENFDVEGQQPSTRTVSRGSVHRATRAVHANGVPVLAEKRSDAAGLANR